MKRVLLATLLVATCIIGTMIALQHVMFTAAQHWISEGVEIPSYQRALFKIALFWSQFWWLTLPLVVVLAFSFVMGIDFVRRAIRQKAGKKGTA